MNVALLVRFDPHSAEVLKGVVTYRPRLAQTLVSLDPVSDWRESAVQDEIVVTRYAADGRRLGPLFAAPPAGSRNGSYHAGAPRTWSRPVDGDRSDTRILDLELTDVAAISLHRRFVSSITPTGAFLLAGSAEADEPRLNAELLRLVLLDGGNLEPSSVRLPFVDFPGSTVPAHKLQRFPEFGGPALLPGGQEQRFA